MGRKTIIIMPTRKKTSVSQAVEKLKLKDIFLMNWATGVIIFGLLTSTAWFLVQNKTLKEDLSGLKSQNSTLKTEQNILKGKVSQLEGANEAYKGVMTTFMDNPPKTLQIQIDALKMRIDRIDGGRNVTTTPTEDFNNATPPPVN